ncbi:hypothetical protein Tco_0976622 [Tanacetum coccineum]|uniref:Uncharacterized protein n=1 Tax=Tanacetum coccineum TaxID=301880 RepID=A0ABQ5EHT8_9ASTR
MYAKESEPEPEPAKKKTPGRTKLKGAPSLTPQEQEATDIMQALKESKKTSRRQPGTRGSNEGTGSKPGVLNESTVISATSSERTEIKDVEGEEYNKGEEKVTDAAKEEDEKTSEAKDDAKKTELPSSSLSLSDLQVLPDIPSNKRNPPDQSPSVQTIPVSVILETTNLPPIPEIITEILVSIVDPSPQVTPIISIIYEIRKTLSELKLDHTSEALAVLQSQVPIVIDSYLDTKEPIEEPIAEVIIDDDGDDVVRDDDQPQDASEPKTSKTLNPEWFKQPLRPPTPDPDWNKRQLFHLDGSDIVDFIMALRMFTRSLILKRRVEDLQLSVESYQKKLNITKPQRLP